MLTSSRQLQNRSFHVVERTRTFSKCQKMKNARAKRAKILFFIVKYANLWGFCCRRRRGCLSSLINSHKIVTISQMLICKWRFRCRCLRPNAQPPPGKKKKGKKNTGLYPPQKNYEKIWGRYTFLNGSVTKFSVFRVNLPKESIPSSHHDSAHIKWHKVAVDFTAELLT